MAEKPPDWDPQKPKEKVCIFCFERAARLAVWRYGVNWVCYEGKCKKRVQEMVGFKGVYPMTQKREAEATYATMELDRREKATRGRSR